MQIRIGGQDACGSPLVELKQFHFTTKGRSLQAVIVVAATEEAEAHEAAAEWCRAKGLDPGRLELQRTEPHVRHGVVYGWDGDY